MSVAQDFKISADTKDDIIILPCDLYSDEPPLESDLQQAKAERLAAKLRELSIDSEV